jgi:hypothetical protein
MSDRVLSGRKMKENDRRNLVGHVSMDNGSLLLADVEHAKKFDVKAARAHGAEFRTDAFGSHPRSPKDANGARAVVLGGIGKSGVFPVFHELDVKGNVKRTIIDYRGRLAEPVQAAAPKPVAAKKSEKADPKEKAKTKAASKKADAKKS